MSAYLKDVCFSYGRDTGWLDIGRSVGRGSYSICGRLMYDNNGQDRYYDNYDRYR